MISSLAARWPRGRNKVLGLLVLVIGCGFLVSTLLVGQYRGAVARQKATDRAFLAYTQNQASHLKNFLDRVEVEHDPGDPRAASVTIYYGLAATGQEDQLSLTMQLTG